VDAINAFAGELDVKAFRADRKTVYALARALEIIPEASRRLPDDLLHGIRRSTGPRSPRSGMSIGMGMKE
jgi:uncharacterized protein with HEPN domain